MRLLVLIVGLITAVECSAQNDAFFYERQKMVEVQLKNRGISNDMVLSAFQLVPRHEFVLPEYKKWSYADGPLPINEGQTISQPYVVAYMTEILELKRSDQVLEIGTGSGYQAAILAQLCDSVFTIELFEELSKSATKVFRKLEYNNIYSRVGDGYLGWPEKAPFDAIIVTCSPSHVPEPLQEQLAEGGSMIIPVGAGNIQKLVLLQKKKGKIRKKDVLPVRFVPMLDERGAKY
ncbi:protein-L-isoaspartate(D-aspartate) O-methyltransferase [Draconibacterium orientale]|uniref:Protein-L-isoaspartate O-methyltransferase n=1 Tax=Draconibacterium orientale TaxID=1168034 RepID=X5DEH4_9BACT|nr:protein-L-isoaspartate(D-aspartate) O-methyltransferase [Draconibacterium orientale]AHW59424.1 protein-L-isoaspartate O-methyltransferase [Draconibacterium orientale]SET26875.1 protein-L-isoaspartate(D-aspartate) O-methyltransferase [Draconibacterium orientale]